jgi:hypothetical protein
MYTSFLGYSFDVGINSFITLTTKEKLVKVASFLFHACKPSPPAEAVLNGIASTGLVFGYTALFFRLKR